MPFKRSLSTHVDAPPEVLYDYLTDFSRHPEWADQPMEMKVEGEPVAPGTTFSTTVKFMGISIRATGRVIEMHRPERFVYECKDSSGTHRWTMEIQPDGEGSRLTQTLERVWVPLHVKLVQARVMWPIWGRPQIGRGLSNIRAHFQSPAPARDPS